MDSRSTSILARKFKVILTSGGPRKINLIKTIRQITGLGLVDAKKMAETHRAVIVTTTNVSAAENYQRLLEASGAEVQIFRDNKNYPIEQTGKNHSEYSNITSNTSNIYEIVLVSSGRKKIDVIKVIRQITGLGLVDAMNLAEIPGIKILSTKLLFDAEKYKQQLENAGAKVEIRNKN